jgi:hypothetical protein
MNPNYRKHFDEATKRVQDRRKVKLEELMKNTYIPLGEGRPVRDNAIGQDDIINLLIDLHKSDTIEQFIERL